jgi:Putative death-receptor fusion protein (DUF2428)
MLITAILDAESEIHSFEMTKTAWTQLTTLAESPLDESAIQSLEPAKWDLPQVHAKNTMRTIFIEAKLASITFAFVERAFAVAINGFTSPIFPMRNSSIMLFDALLTRALGQKYARQDIDPSAPNRSVSSKVFFAKFPQLYTYLLAQLRQDVTKLGDEGVENTGLYPILTLLARLDVTRVYDSKKYTGMADFRPLIRECLHGRVWRIRAMAARCIPVVLDPEDLEREIGEMFAELRLDSQNALHGNLMGIKRLAEFYSFRTLKDVVFGIPTVGWGADDRGYFERDGELHGYGVGEE